MFVTSSDDLAMRLLRALHCHVGTAWHHIFWRVKNDGVVDMNLMSKFTLWSRVTCESMLCKASRGLSFASTPNSVSH